jgi:uncharacterized cupredoxin-like copper-binding protein
VHITSFNLLKKGNIVKQVLIIFAFISVFTQSAMALAHGKAEQTAYGISGVSNKITRTIQIDMGDSFRFSPDSVTIKKGETIKFVIYNKGKVLHEMVIGTLNDLKEHAEMMKQMPDMQHNDANMVRVMPNKTGKLIWTFNKSGRFDFACLQSGHSEAGMLGKLIVK